MRTARRRSLRALLALWLAVLIACVQATGRAVCAEETAADRDETCCCAGAAGGGCCDASETGTPRVDQLVGACGCSHQREPGATAHLSGPTVGPDQTVSLPEPSAGAVASFPRHPWRVTTRPAPEPPPPRARA